MSSFDNSDTTQVAQSVMLVRSRSIAIMQVSVHSLKPCRSKRITRHTYFPHAASCVDWLVTGCYVLVAFNRSRTKANDYNSMRSIGGLEPVKKHDTYTMSLELIRG